MTETAMSNGAQSRRFARVLALAAVVALPACGGGSPSTPSTPAPTPPPRTVLPTQTFVGLQVNEARFFAGDVEVLVPSATFEATADWTFAFNDLDIYVTSTSCAGVTSEALSAGACALFARADSVSAKPERLSFVANQGRYRVWVANFGPGVDSGTLQIIVTGR